MPMACASSSVTAGCALCAIAVVVSAEPRNKPNVSKTVRLFMSRSRSHVDPTPCPPPTNLLVALQVKLLRLFFGDRCKSCAEKSSTQSGVRSDVKNPVTPARPIHLYLYVLSNLHHRHV